MHRVVLQRRLAKLGRLLRKTGALYPARKRCAEAVGLLDVRRFTLTALGMFLLSLELVYFTAAVAFTMIFLSAWHEILGTIAVISVDT
jgi:hypothetical protein